MALSGPQTETDLCNAALALLGVDIPLGDVGTEDTVNARRCRTALPLARDGLLAAYPWNFAARRASLPAADQTPPWGFAGAFHLPADFLRLRAVRGEGQGRRGVHTVEQGSGGRVILSDLPAPLDILYTARVTSVGLYDSQFTEALVARLAADLAVPVTQTRTLHDTMVRLALFRLEDAQLADAREGTVADRLPDGSWLEART